MDWLEDTMIGFDTETTGVNTSTDRIVTAAVISRQGADGVPDRRTWLIDPGVEIPIGATAIHGITTLRASAEGAPPEEALEEIAATLAETLLSGRPIVGFNVSFDLAILEADLARHGLSTLTQRIGVASPSEIRPIVDPLVLDRHLTQWRKGKRKLIDLCEAYGVLVNNDSLHSADADVLATLDLLVAMGRVHSPLREMDLQDLHDLQITAHRTWAESFRAWLISRGRTDDLPDPGWPLPAGGPPVAHTAQGG
ncbi:MAG: DNA polymerase III subunit epsilon [Demequinaceae bacterium]|nr:DNA polymerase III subunit epsilon [Demequinaceae bacterium]